MGSIHEQQRPPVVLSVVVPAKVYDVGHELQRLGSGVSRHEACGEGVRESKAGRALHPLSLL